MIRAGQTGDHPVPYLLTAQGRAATAARRRATLARTLGLTPRDGAAPAAPRPLAGPPALDPCPAYLTVPGPDYTMHTVYCTEPYGHGDLDDGAPMHLGSIIGADRFGQRVAADIVWYGK